MLLPITYQPPSTNSSPGPYATDKVSIYLEEGESATRFSLVTLSLVLVWNISDTLPPDGLKNNNP